MQYGENCASEADFGGRNMGMGGSSASYGNAKLVDAPTPEVLACVENLGRDVKEMQDIDSQALKIRQTVFHIESVLSRLGL
jgi:hypothetical protein